MEQRTIAAIEERIDRNGKVVVPIDLDQVTSAVRRLVDEEGAEAIAVSFVWSFANRVHEDQAVAAIAEIYPDLPVVAGAVLHPAIREYERTTFAVLNAYVSGAFAGIEELEDALTQRGLRSPLLLVHSGGGSITVGEAAGGPSAWPCQARPPVLLPPSP